MPLVIAALVCASVVAVVIATYYAVTAESPIAQRLRTMIPEATLSTRPAPVERTGGAARLLAAIGSLGFARSERTLAQRLSAAGIRGPNAVAMFLGARMLVSVGPALLILVPQLSRGRPLGQTLWLAFICWATGLLAANAWLRRRGRVRTQRVAEGLPDSLDLMVVCLESGLGLNATIARVGEERAMLDDVLGAEFAQVAFELRSGRSREDALRSFGDRNGVEDLKALAGLVIQSDRLGASMAKTLRAHADLLRTKRRQRAEEQARKLPVKVLFPLATLLLPPLFIMVAGPAFLRLQDLTRLITNR